MRGDRLVRTQLLWPIQHLIVDSDIDVDDVDDDDFDHDVVHRDVLLLLLHVSHLRNLVEFVAIDSDEQNSF